MRSEEAAAKNIQNLEDLENAYPGLPGDMREFFRLYKVGFSLYKVGFKALQGTEGFLDPTK